MSTSAPMIRVLDLEGKHAFTIEGQIARDGAGKRIGERVAPGGAEAQSNEQKLAATASRLMSERKVLLDLAPADVATAATQASFGLGERSWDWIADEISRIRLIKKDRGVWYPENAPDAIKLALPNVSADAFPPVVSPAFTPVTFTCTGYGLATKLPRSTVDNADFDLKERSLRFLVEALRRAREYRVAQLLMTSANWATANRIAAVAKWNGGVTANPLTDTFAALAASYLPANAIVMPENAAPFYFANANSTSLRDYRQAWGELPGIYFARAKFLLTGTPTYIWSPSLPTNVAVLRIGDPNYPSSQTFRWLGDGGSDGAICDGMLVRQFRDDRDQSDWLVCAHYDAEVIVSNQVGAVITGALQ